MLSLSLPLANVDAEAANAGGFAPNAFIRIEGNGQIVLTMPYVEMAAPCTPRVISATLSTVCLTPRSSGRAPSRRRASAS